MKEIEQILSNGIYGGSSKMYLIYYVVDKYNCGERRNCVTVMIANNKKQALELFDKLMRDNRIPYIIKEVKGGKECSTGTCVSFELNNPF